MIKWWFYSVKYSPLHITVKQQLPAMVNIVDIRQWPIVLQAWNNLCALRIFIYMDKDILYLSKGFILADFIPPLARCITGSIENYSDRGMMTRSGKRGPGLCHVPCLASQLWLLELVLQFKILLASKYEGPFKPTNHPDRVETHDLKN